MSSKDIIDPRGYVSIWRSLADDSLWLSEPFTRGQAWVDLVMLANYSPNFFYLRGNRVDVGIGELAWSEENLSKRWRWSRNKVRGFLKMLISEQQIEQQKSRVINKIKIINYSYYQKKDNRKHNRKTSKEQQKDTNNNKNNKNKENNYTLLFEEFWRAYPKNGSSKKDAFKKYNKAIENGANENEIIERAREYNGYCQNTDTKIAHATTWLNQERWTIDYRDLYKSQKQKTSRGSSQDFKQQLERTSNLAAKFIEDRRRES